MLMGDAEGMKKEASKVIQTTKQHNTTKKNDMYMYVNIPVLCSAKISDKRGMFRHLSDVLPVFLCTHTHTHHTTPTHPHPHTQFTFNNGLRKLMCNIDTS